MSKLFCFLKREERIEWSPNFVSEVPRVLIHHYYHYWPHFTDLNMPVDTWHPVYFTLQKSNLIS